MKKIFIIILFVLFSSCFAEVIQKKRLDVNNIYSIDNRNISFLLGIKHSSSIFVENKYINMFSGSAGTRIAMSQNEAILLSLDASFIDMNRIDKRKKITSYGYYSRFESLYLMRPNPSSTFIKTNIKTKNKQNMTSLNDGVSFGFGPVVYFMNSKKFDSDRLFIGSSLKLGYEFFVNKKMNTEIFAEYNYLFKKEQNNSFINLGINFIFL